MTIHLGSYSEPNIPYTHAFDSKVAPLHGVQTRGTNQWLLALLLIARSSRHTQHARCECFCAQWINTWMCAILMFNNIHVHAHIPYVYVRKKLCLTSMCICLCTKVLPHIHLQVLPTDRIIMDCFYDNDSDKPIKNGYFFNFQVMPLPSPPFFYYFNPSF